MTDHDDARLRFARTLLRHFWGTEKGLVYFGDLSHLRKAFLPGGLPKIAQAWCDLGPEEQFWISASHCSPERRTGPAGVVWVKADDAATLDRAALPPSLWFYDFDETYAAWLLEAPATPWAIDAASQQLALHLGAARQVPVRGNEMTAIPLPVLEEVRVDSDAPPDKKVRRIAAFIAESHPKPILPRYPIEALIALEERDLDFEQEVAAEARKQAIRDRARELRSGIEVHLPQNFYSLDEELKVNNEPIDWTIGELHQRGTNSLLAAQFKAGKTTFSLNLVRSLVDCEPFLGCFEVAELDGRVAFWNYEMAPQSIRAWFASLAINRIDRVTLLNLRDQPFHLVGPAPEREAVEWLKQHEIGFWIIDPFVRAYGSNENDNELVSRFLEALDSIKARAGVVDLLLLHHMGRKEHEEGKEHGRGATRLDDWADSILTLTKNPEGDRFLRAEGRDVHAPRRLLHFDADTRLLTLDQTEGASGRQASHHAAATRMEKDIIRIIGQQPGILAGDLRVAVSGNDAAFLRAKKKLAAVGALVIQERGQLKRHFLPGEAPGARK